MTDGQHPILLTGATGFLGAAVVERLLARGQQVVAVVRDGTKAPDGTVSVEIDLSATGAADHLRETMDHHGCWTVIHLAAKMVGTDLEHEDHTLAPTRAVLGAIRAVTPTPSEAPSLVLASSFSVYSYTGQPVNSVLDETSPTEGDASRRDAYARAKLAQEQLVISDVQRRGLRARILRPGAIIGEGREWTSRIGFEKGPVAVLLGGRARLPLIEVRDCAEAFALGALAPMGPSDVHSSTAGCLDIINVVDDSAMSQKEYLATLRERGISTAKFALPVPWKLLEKGSELVGVAMDLAPPLAGRVPGVLRPETLHARAKPLRFSNARLKDRLGWAPINREKTDD